MPGRHVGAASVVRSPAVDPIAARSALVLSGGGVGGAYEVGVMKALYEGRVPFLGGQPPMRADIFTGTSVGSYNAAFMAQQQTPDANGVTALQRIWQERIADTAGSCGNGIYRLRADPLRLFHPGCLRDPFRLLAETAADTAFWGSYALAYGRQFLDSEGSPQDRAVRSLDLAAAISREPLESLLRDTLDLGGLRSSPSELAVAVSDWQNGRVLILRKGDVTERLGTDAILASTAIPGIFAPVLLDGVSCVDGGLLMNTPFKPAVEAGAEVLHVVYTDPYLSNIAMPPLPNSIATFSRIYAVLVGAQFNGDLRHAATINEEIAEHASIAVAGSSLAAVRAHRTVGAGRVAARSRQSEHKYRPLEIHRYRPGSPYAAANDLLDFSSSVIEALIEQGYREASSHDCRASECVLPWKGNHDDSER